MFIGLKANRIVKKLGKDHTNVKDFMNRVGETNVECGKYIQSKLPLENETLKAFTAIDPLLICSPSKLVLKRLLFPNKLVLKCLLFLPTLVPIVLEYDEENTFQKEVHALCVDGNLPSPLNGLFYYPHDNKIDCLE